MFRTKVTLSDLLAAAFVVTLACAVLLLPLAWRKKGNVLVVTTSDGSTEYSLAQDREFYVRSNGITLCIVIKDGMAYVKESDCKDGVCRSSGKISKNGESIICAPAGVRIMVKGGESNVDFVAG